MEPTSVMVVWVGHRRGVGDGRKEEEEEEGRFDLEDKEVVEIGMEDVWREEVKGEEEMNEREDDEGEGEGEGEEVEVSVMDGSSTVKDGVNTNDVIKSSSSIYEVDMTSNSNEEDSNIS
jgi:hypothetical protein